MKRQASELSMVSPAFAMSHVGRRTHRVREVRYCVFYWVSDAVRYVCESCRRCIHANIANKRVCFPRVSGCRPV